MLSAKAYANTTNEGGLNTQGCKKQVLIYIPTDNITANGREEFRDGCYCDGTKRERKTTHVFIEGKYVGTNGYQCCPYHIPGTEPPVSKKGQIKKLLGSIFTD